MLGQGEEISVKEDVRKNEDSQLTGMTQLSAEMSGDLSRRLHAVATHLGYQTDDAKSRERKSEGPLFDAVRHANDCTKTAHGLVSFIEQRLGVQQH